MTTIPLTSSELPALGASSSDRLIRSALFLVVFLQIWLTATPFPDLSDPGLLDPISDGNFIGQVLAVLVTGLLAAFVFAHRPNLLLKAASPALIVTFLWFVCSAAVSSHAELAARRLVLAAFIIFQAAVLLLLPQERNHFARLLAAGALIVLALCYAGVIFMPELSIHQSSDVAEPEIAGDWRGFFTHKNGAGASMAILVFFGIFIGRSLNLVLGTMIVALAWGFLLFTHSKSPISLLPLVLILSFVLDRLRNPVAKFVAAIGMPIVIGILTVGSVEFDAVHALVDKLVSDSSFTGRNDIWRFTLDHIAERPVFGFGYQAFWRTSELVNSWTYLESWGYRASDAHNGFLNIAVMTGLVGLAVSMAWIFVQPFLDQLRTPRGRIDPALNMMFLQVWLFGLSVSGFESELFNGGSVVWFMMAVSIIGLHFQATTQYAPVDR